MGLPDFQAGPELDAKVRNLVQQVVTAMRYEEDTWTRILEAKAALDALDKEWEKASDATGAASAALHEEIKQMADQPDAEREMRSLADDRDRDLRIIEDPHHSEWARAIGREVLRLSARLGIRI